jgi:hypothetical protein
MYALQFVPSSLVGAQDTSHAFAVSAFASYWPPTPSQLQQDSAMITPRDTMRVGTRPGRKPGQSVVSVLLFKIVMLGVYQFERPGRFCVSINTRLERLCGMRLISGWEPRLDAQRSRVIA